MVKRFGDFCAAFGAFAAFMYIFRQYMGMNFDEELEGITDKLKYFFSNEPVKEYRFYLALFIIFALSFVISTALHKFPYIPLAVSALPLIQTVIMFDEGYIYERPMVFVVLSAAHIICCIFECVRRDRDDRGRRTALALDLFGLCSVGFLGYIIYLSKGITEVDFTKINVIEKTLYEAIVYGEAELSGFWYAVIAISVTIVLRWIWQDLYFIDAALSLVLAGASVYFRTADKIPVFGATVCALTITYFLGRIAVMLFCKAKYNDSVADRNE